MRQALDYLKQDGSKMTAVRQLELTLPQQSTRPFYARQ